MTCPKCGSSLKCIGGESAHPDNWYCSQEQRCGWKAWDPVIRGTTDHAEFQKWWKDIGKPMYDGDSGLCALRAWQHQQAKVDALRAALRKIAEFRARNGQADVPESSIASAALKEVE